MTSNFPLSCFQRNLIAPFSRYRTLCETRKNTCEFLLYCWDHVLKVNEWCFGDYFHREFSVSSQIMVCDYYIAKCKTFSACGELLIAIFFAIQNIYVNLNPHIYFTFQARLLLRKERSKSIVIKYQ